MSVKIEPVDGALNTKNGDEVPSDVEIRISSPAKSQEVNPSSSKKEKVTAGRRGKSQRKPVFHELRHAHESELRKAFDAHDEDSSGAIDIMQLGMIAVDLGEPLTEEELREVMRDLDHDNTGVISFEEFVTWWRHDQHEEVEFLL